MLENLSETSPITGHENERRRYLLDSNRKGNSEITVETVRIINEELSTEMSRKLEEIKRGLDSQILTANNT